jgi:hypothetical protein
MIAPARDDPTVIAAAALARTIEEFKSARLSILFTGQKTPGCGATCCYENSAKHSYRWEERT